MSEQPSEPVEPEPEPEPQPDPNEGLTEGQVAAIAAMKATFHYDVVFIARAGERGERLLRIARGENVFAMLLETTACVGQTIGQGFVLMPAAAVPRPPSEMSVPGVGRGRILRSR